jgi:predicted ATPase/DNA-binding SARP family transcriptional activator/class 3 adenylate cyclase
MTLQFGVLGPLGVWSDGEAVALTGAKRRGLLAYLLAHAGEPQPLDRIVDALWGETATRGSEATVQTYVSQLRKLFGADGPPLAHRAGGYVLDLNPEALDASRFEAAVAAASAVEDRDQRLAMLDEALALWRGAPLDEFAGQAWADERARQWTRMHVLANQLRITALLDAGRHRDALPTLEQLVAVHPLHEPFWAQLIVARYRCGQQADALAAAREARNVLASELGIEPGPELVELENKVLAQDASLAAPAFDADPSPEHRGGTVVEPLPAGIVTFLLTDIAGSAALWDLSPDEMAKALVRHEDVIAEVVHAHDGRLLKSRGEGDATLSVFAKATDAVAGAIALQRRLRSEAWPGDLELPTRIALHTGEAQLRAGDYYGGTLNRAARIRGIAEGGEVLLSRSTHDLVADVLADDVELVALGEHEMRGMRRAELVYGIAGAGLLLRDTARRTEDPAPAARVPGNLPIQVTSLVGRRDELRELHALVRAHRLVTLTGAGGVGKTRLALQVATDVAGDFPDGVWVVELAPVGDAASVPDAVAAALGISQSAGSTPTDAVVDAVSGRQMLVVLDNCEHVLRAAADVAEALVTRADTVHVVAASRESLRVAAERVWSVPALDVTGPASPGVELFVQRARAVCPTFDLDDPADAAAATEICQSLDGLALAIELAAARMLTMSPTDVRDRLRDRFRMLSGPGGGFEHHQTLGKAVSWSYDLLDADERTLLDRCSVFADGFDLTAAATIFRATDADEYAVLDLLDSLVRKSLITTQRADGHVRFGLLETIRQFGEDRLQQTGSFDEVHDLHASYFAQQAENNWSRWNGPDQLDALNWVDREFANLRAAFRWAADNDELECAVSVAAHTAMLTMGMQRFEPVGWVEEILDAATEAEVVQLPRLYTAGCVCVLMGRPEVAVERGQRAQALEADPRFEPFEHGWSRAWEAFGHRYCGRIDTMFEICDELAAEPGLAHVIGQVLALSVLPGVGRSEEARALAEPALAAARELDIPYWVAYALTGYARAFVDSDPAMAMDLMHEALDYDRRQRLVYFEVAAIKDLAGLEEALGRPEHALELLDTAVFRYHAAGNHASVATTLCFAAVVFNRLEQAELAATIYGMSIPHGIGMVPHLPGVLDHVRDVLGDERFDRCVDLGAAMEFDEAMELVRREIASARRELAASSG